jgi:hypothetical protein
MLLSVKSKRKIFLLTTPYAAQLEVPTLCFAEQGKVQTVEICSLRYPTRFTLIAHLKYPGLKRRGEKVGSKCVVLCPFAGNT